MTSDVTLCCPLVGAYACGKTPRSLGPPPEVVSSFGSPSLKTFILYRTHRALVSRTIVAVVFDIYPDFSKTHATPAGRKGTRIH